MTLEKLRELSVLDAAFMIRVGHADACLEDVFPFLTTEKLTQVRNRVNKFADVAFGWGAEYMNLVYQQDIDDQSRERAFVQLQERHDREYEARWTDFSESSRSLGEVRGKIANR